MHFLSVYRDAGFLASLSSDVAAGDLVFDHVIYNNGSHYNPTTGIYTVPIQGYYLITEQVSYLILNLQIESLKKLWLGWVVYGVVESLDWWPEILK